MASLHCPAQQLSTHMSYALHLPPAGVYLLRGGASSAAFIHAWAQAFHKCGTGLNDQVGPGLENGGGVAGVCLACMYRTHG